MYYLNYRKCIVVKRVLTVYDWKNFFKSSNPEDGYMLATQEWVPEFKPRNPREKKPWVWLHMPIILVWGRQTGRSLKLTGQPA